MGFLINAIHKSEPTLLNSGKGKHKKETKHPDPKKGFYIAKMSKNIRILYLFMNKKKETITI